MSNSRRNQKNPYKKNIVFFLLAILFLFLSKPARAADGLTQKDRYFPITLKEKVKEIDKRFEQIDKKFEQKDKRFEQVDKRFGEMISFFRMIIAIFAAITATTICFTLWDRRSMIRPFESKVKEIEEGKIDKVISSLRNLAETNEKVANVLRRHNL